LGWFNHQLAIGWLGFFHSSWAKQKPTLLGLFFWDLYFRLQRSHRKRKGLGFLTTCPSDLGAALRILVFCWWFLGDARKREENHLQGASL